MLEKLLDYENLGSPEEIKFLINNVLSLDQPKKIKDIKQYCMSHSITFFYSLAGIIELLKALSVINMVDADHAALTEHGLALKKKSSSHFEFCNWIAETLLLRLRENNSLQYFLTLEHVKFDILLDAIIVKNNQIPLNYSGIKNLLINLGFFIPDRSSPNALVIQDNFSDFFESNVLIWLKSELISNASYPVLSLEQFKELQKIKESRGQNAELFVVDYERARLHGHPLKNRIRIISNIDVGAGYDIVSFNSMHSRSIDRFIEVKSFSKNLGFFWSRNEISSAQLRGDDYFLYIVDSNKIQKDCCEPTIIQNPFKNVFLSEDWEKEENTWYISKRKIH